MNIKLIDLSIIIPTYHRREVLSKTIRTIALQSYQPKEIIIVDASDEFSLIDGYFEHLQSEIIHVPAKVKGATNQRMQAFNISKYNIIGFMDDDVYLEPGCFEELWRCLNSSDKIGGVNAIIINQKYHPPGKISSIFYSFMNGGKLLSYAGRCIGPGINFLPDDAASLPNYIKVDWLNLGCTLYRKQSLPNPLFKSHFYGYSMMEDLTLSLEIGQNWDLYTVKNAKLFHDSQPNNYKNNVRSLACMDLFNRYMLMITILNKNTFKDKFKLFSHQLFNAVATKNLLNRDYILGKLDAAKKIKDFKLRS